MDSPKLSLYEEARGRGEVQEHQMQNQSRQKAICYLTTEAAVRRLTIVLWTSQASWVLDVFELGSLRLRLSAARRARLV